MKKHFKLIISIAIIVSAVIFGIIYSAYNSYSDTNIKTTENNINKHNDKADASIKTNSNRKKTKSNDNIFLQDKQNPDRILAIHPFGTKGVYEFRKQANGNIYPEHKFFDGKISKSNSGNISVTPNKSNNGARKIAIEKTQSGELKDHDSGTAYTALQTKQESDVTHYEYKDNSTGEEGKISDNNGSPLYGPDYNGTFEYNPNSLYRVAPGQFYQPSTHTIYGQGDFYKTYDRSTFNYHIDDDPNSAMYYKQNGLPKDDKASTELHEIETAKYYPHVLE
ncbi:hypothetical protein [Companilactobacillus mishanensis]|uniref:Uncharacterized protein n=1 Tax=Companilactobacillus mishanensis TaxID=2486008 RepID=A0ABW9P674_9LACO|nr:hypothetical protein [Companilactobacillus mishanensis]MQS44743.1 hypothetical protein [Companilactobacillus mishanensis]